MPEQESANRPQAPTRPNFIVILADDMGYSDIGCFGSEILTPNLDRLGSEGIRFTQMYNCARCCPSRASLLTGLYPHQAGIGHMVYDKGVPAYQGYLSDNCLTIAEALRAGGYRTYMSGKWHVGGSYSLPDRPNWRPGTPGYPTPVTRGFDRFYGTLVGAGNYFNPYGMMRDDKLIEPDEGDFYFTDAISDNAVAMIEDADTRGEPFFLYVSYTAPHWPLQALQRDIDKYVGKYRSGWDAVRTGRHEELKGSGILDPKWDISPRDEQAPPWSDLDKRRREWEDIRMAVYAAQIDSMDQGIGRILKTLEDLDLSDDTVVMFLSDNGGCAEFLAEDGWLMVNRRPTRDGRKVQVGNVFGRIPGPEDVFMSYDLPWTNASNSPFRLFKSWVHEGGIATPFIVRWGDVTVGGGINHAVMHVIDIMATCMELAGVECPQERDGRGVTPLEGESFAPILRGGSWSRREPLFWEHEGNRAVRLGDWKLVSQHPERWELYRIDEDRTELNDLAGANGPRVKELESLYRGWAERCGVLPWDELGRLP